MSENRNIYIEKLLSEIKSLEESVLIIKKSDSMSFSFFRESFEKTQEISNLLHKLEFMQVDDMKNQMEKLVFFLSESEKKGKVQERELEKARENERELTKDLDNERQRNKVQKLQTESEVAASDVKEQEEIEHTDIEEHVQSRNIYAEGFVLPEYRNPHHNDIVDRESKQGYNYEPVDSKSVNTPVHIIDIKRGVSLNDRFLFQRELFNNSRNEMNNTLDKLNSLSTYEEAEEYIRDNYSWDFDSQIVSDFLLVVKKGFK